jgi:hypothetical protein
MGIGASLVLVALGAILTWAVHADIAGLNVTAIGVILMIVGAVGLLLSMVFWSSWGGPGAIRSRRTTYVEEPPADRYVERY